MLAVEQVRGRVDHAADRVCAEHRLGVGADEVGLAAWSPCHIQMPRRLPVGAAVDTGAGRLLDVQRVRSTGPTAPSHSVSLTVAAPPRLWPGPRSPIVISRRSSTSGASGSVDSTGGAMLFAR